MPELSRVVLATGNKGKLRDFALLFADSGIELSVPADHGVNIDVEETGSTFEENALLKARAHARMLDLPVLSDDSGLAVEALGGAPGVYSARYAGTPCDDHANNMKVVGELKGLEDRRAAFVAVLALVLPGGDVFRHDLTDEVGRPLLLAHRILLGGRASVVRTGLSRPRERRPRSGWNY